jgi:hypothetical protein
VVSVDHDGHLDLLARLHDAAQASLEAAHTSWEVAFRAAEATAVEGAAWEAKVQAMTVHGLIDAARQMVDSR